MNLFVNILSILISVYFIYKLYRDYKKINSIDEKAIFLTVFIIFFVPLIAYYCDIYNLFSKMGWFENTNSDRWFNFFITYFSALVSSLIAAVVLFLMTSKQTNLEREKDLNDKRIQNAPLLKYSIQNDIIDNAQQRFVFSDFNEENKLPYSTYFKVENIGLNSAKKLEVEVFIEDKSYGRYKLDDLQSILKKDENKVINFCFSFKPFEESEKNYRNIKYIVEYSDILNNKYKQMIEVKAYTTTVSGRNSSGYDLELSNIIVYDEEVIKE